MLEVEPQFQYGPKALNGYLCELVGGQQVPLSTLVNSTIKAAPIVINHQGLFPSVTISFNLQPGVALGNAVAAIQQVEKELASRSRSPPASRAMRRRSSRRCRARRC